MKKAAAICVVGFVAVITVGILRPQKKSSTEEFVNNVATIVRSEPTITPTPTLPSSKILANDYHIFQTFNNCGPAALSMALSYFGITVSQQELGLDIRPNQSPKGIQDDKSVTLDELGVKAREYGLIPYHRPNGSVEIVRKFIANDMPIVARTWLKPDEDIGHYRVVKGYDDSMQSFIQDDSLQGKNLWYSYDEFIALWEAFNYEYVVFVPAEKIEIAEQILGEDRNEQKSWQNAAKISLKKFEMDPNNIYAGFNASVAFSKTKQHDKAVDLFEKVESKLSRRMLWYQLDPILSFLATSEYDRVMSLTNAILRTENNAHAELFLIRAFVFQQQGKIQEAKSSYQQSIRYNQNLLKYQTIFPADIIEDLRTL